MDQYASVVRSWEAPAGAPPEALATLVDEARAHGTEVHLFLSPVHPTLDQEVGPWYEYMRARMLSSLETLCRPGVLVHDLSDLVDDGQAYDFYDGWHFSRPTAIRLGSALASGSSQVCPLGAPVTSAPAVPAGAR